MLLFLMITTKEYCLVPSVYLLSKAFLLEGVVIIDVGEFMPSFMLSEVAGVTLIIVVLLLSGESGIWIGTQ